MKSLEDYNKVMTKFFEWRNEYKNFYGEYPERVLVQPWSN